MILPSSSWLLVLWKHQWKNCDNRIYNVHSWILVILPDGFDWTKHTCCHTPNRFGTVNMEDNINIERSWCEGWARWSLIVAIYCTRRLSWCKRQLPMSSSHHSHKNRQEAEETEGIMSIMVWEGNAIYCSPTPIPERAKKLKNWWRNKGKKRRNDVSAQMSFLGAQCRHSDILNSSIVSKAIRHVTIPSESLEHGLSACQVPMWIRSFPTEIFPLQSRRLSHQSLWSLYFLWIISPLLLQISTMSCS